MNKTNAQLRTEDKNRYSLLAETKRKMNGKGHYSFKMSFNRMSFKVIFEKFCNDSLSKDEQEVLFCNELKPELQRKYLRLRNIKQITKQLELREIKVYSIKEIKEEPKQIFERFDLEK